MWLARIETVRFAPLPQAHDDQEQVTPLPGEDVFVMCAAILAQLAWAGRLQADGLHPDAAGAALVANELAAAIDHWRTT